MADEPRTTVIERRSIDFIPHAERHGSPFNLFTLWFAGNMQITTIVTGALAVAIGLSLPWALVAIVVGNLLGGIVMALHSAQGPRMGIPQMIQSRAQFGFYGAILPLVLVIVMYIGFFASSGVLGGQALSSWTGIPVTPSIIIVAAVCTILAIFGYDLIHRYASIVSLLFLIGFVYLSIRLFTANNFVKDSGRAALLDWHVLARGLDHGDLADHLRAVCRGLLALFARKHEDRHHVLVDFWRVGDQFDLDDGLRQHRRDRGGEPV